MEAWRSRFKESRERFLEDDEEDDENMQMAVDQFQNFIDYDPPSRGVRVVHAKAKLLTLSETEWLWMHRCIRTILLIVLLMAQLSFGVDIA
jgi:hypothetical protein